MNEPYAQRRHHDEGGDVAGDGVAPREAFEKGAKGEANSQRFLEFRAAPVDEVKPDMAGSVGVVTIFAGVFCQPDRSGGDHLLGGIGAARQLLDTVSILVARSEVHLCIGPGGIGVQGRLNDAHRLDEEPPIHRVQVTQTADAVTDRDLIGGLGLIRGSLELLAGEVLVGEAVLHPALDRGEGLSLSPTVKTGGERLDELI